MMPLARPTAQPSGLPSPRPTLTTGALQRWLPAMARRAPDLVSAYVIPGRVAPRMREAAMLGVTSVDRCRACARVHERWGTAVGLDVGDPLGFLPGEAAAWAYGQAVATHGPWAATLPAGLPARHRRELQAAAIAMHLANLSGNRFLPGRGPRLGSGIGAALAARLYDLGMRVADRAGLRRARARIVSRVTGNVLEIGIGTGLNLALYPAGASLQAIDPSACAIDVAATRASRLRKYVLLTLAEAEALPYPDDTFDVVVGTFVLCTVRDVAGALAEARRVLRPGGSLRVLEHGRSDRAAVARLQTTMAPAWASVAGGCRLAHDVRGAIGAAGFRITEERSRGDGVLVEVVATLG